MSMQCRGQLRHEVTKKMIKAALKLHAYNVIQYLTEVSTPLTFV